MWRLANFIYRTFRNVAAHRYSSQDIVVSITTIHNQDDDTSNENAKQENLIKDKLDFHDIVKNAQLSFENIEKLQKYLYKKSSQQLILKFKLIEFSKIKFNEIETSCKEKEEISNASLQADEIYTHDLKNLSELQEETISIINNQSAIEAFEEGNIELGIKTLQLSAKTGKNSAALYNLGICYEQGFGVEKDRMKACDYYRQAARLGHVNAFINLTHLSNNIDDNDKYEEQITTKQSSKLPLAFTNTYEDSQSQLWNDYTLKFSKTLTCLS